MKVTFVSLCAGLATLALAEALPNQELRPRYYYPQQVKRQILGLNLNNLTGDATTTSDSASATPQDGLLNGLTGDGSTTSIDTSTAGPNSDDPTPTTTSVKLGLTGLLGNDPTTTPVASDDTSQATPTSSDNGNLLSTLLGNTDTETSATPTPVTTEPPVAQPTTTDDGNLLSSLLGKDPTTTPAEVDAQPTTTGDGNLLSSLLNKDPPTTTAAEVTPEPTTTKDGNIISSILGTGILPTSEIVVPTSQTLVTPPPETTQGPRPTSEGPADPPSSTFVPTSGPPQGTTSGGTSPPSSSVEPPPVVTSSHSPVEPSSVAPPATTSEAAPTAAKPSATNSLTSLPEVSTIVSASPSSKVADTASSTASAIPTNLPSSIQPNGGIPQAPANGTLIQLGFTYGLNYPFVVSNNWAVQQIFDYLPPGVANGVKIANGDVVMQYLQPYNTLTQLGYITTLAMAYIPPEQVNELSLALLNPNSDLYNNPNPTVKTLMNMLDPSIPLIAGSSIGNGNPINSANTNTNGNNNNGAAAGGDEGSSGSNVKPSSIGIGVGVVGGAAVYGVAMFMVAKRYKKRKAHKRSSSVSTDGSRPPMAEHSTLMTGARNSYGSRQPMNGAGRDSRNSDRSRETGRTYISPPVATENSLGWN